MDYKTWNDEIASHFFCEENSQERVYLRVSRDLIQSIGTSRGLDVEECLSDFVSAVKSEHRWSKKGVAEVPLHLLKLSSNWDKLWEEGCPFPPYIGFLGLFVFAAGYDPENEFESASYYPRLNSILGRDLEAPPPSGFEEMGRVWEHLESWANQEERGRLGIFEIHYIDKRPHVGIPRSQRVLTERERKVAKWVFSESGLDPALSPAEEQVAALVRSKGRGKVRELTYSALARNSNRSGYRRALIEAILEVLHSWDGSPVEIEREDAGKGTGYRGTLALSFKESFGEIQFTARCLTRRDFPEGELVLENENGKKYTCHEVVGGWSTVLRDQDGNDLDPTGLDLSSSYKLEDPDQNWVFTLRPAEVRVFVKPQEQGLPTMGGHVEARQLPLKTPFYLLVEDDAEAGAIESWGSSSCEDFEQVERNGLPSSWHLYRSNGAHDDQGVRGKYDVLSQPREVQVTLDRGIRVHPHRNEYFSFAPPSIRVRGSDDSKVFLNGNRLSEPDGELYRLPAKHQTDGEYTATVKAGGEVVKKKHFFLQSQTGWKDVPSVEVNRFGSLQEKDKDCIGERRIESQDVDLKEIPLNLLPHLFRQANGKVILLGATPGQVTVWPDEELPEDWQSVWAVPKDGRACYCWPGSSPPAPQPVPDLNRPGGPLYPRSSINKWEEVLYYWRKRIQPPERHTDLWKQYRQHAQDKC